MLAFHVIITQHSAMCNMLLDICAILTISFDVLGVAVNAMLSTYF